MTTSSALPSLRSQFTRAQSIYNTLEKSDLGSSDPKYQEDLKEAITTLMNCSVMVRRLDLFSKNETVEDISTSNLRYLLISAYLGSLTLLLSAPKEESDMLTYRLKVLSVSQSHYNSYLSDLETYEILNKIDKTYMETHLESNTLPKPDATTTRTEKITRYKRRKATESQIELLSQHLHNRSDSQTQRDDETVDEEMDRKLVLALLDLFVQKALDDLLIIRDELSLLEPMVKSQNKQIDTTTRVDENSSLSINTKDQSALLDASGKILRPFVITSKRDQIRKGVFRPHWNLPTMSVEEYLDLEMQRGNILSGGGKIPEKKVLEDSDEAQDAETYRLRKWDEFKDFNPRGSGNRLNHG